MSSTVITRFAVSPTGNLHIGGARTALFAYLSTKGHGGTYLLRIDDTDKERNKKEYEKDIIESFAWLGIEHDNKEKIFRQSEQIELHREKLQELIQTGKAYEAEASEKGDGKVVRFKNPNTTITFSDLVRGEVTIDTTDLGDFVLARTISDPLYHFSSVVDDIASGITHIIRAEEHISNTPRQILITEALGAKRPVYAHIPLILASDRSKLSKRKGETSVSKYRAMGYLPEAMINYLALLGWHPKDDREIFSMDELIKEFDLSRAQKGGAIFDIEKLRSINKKYLQNMTDRDFLEAAKKHLPDGILGLLEAKSGLFERLLPLFRERIEIFSDIREMAKNGELDYFAKAPQYEKGDLVWKGDSLNNTKTHLETIASNLSGLSEKDFTQERIKDSVWEYASEQGRGSVLWPMRYALSGREKSPDPFVLTEILGKEETLERINYAIELLS